MESGDKGKIPVFEKLKSFTLHDSEIQKEKSSKASLFLAMRLTTINLKKTLKIFNLTISIAVTNKTRPHMN